MFELGLKLLLSYLVGSVNGALALGRVRGIDIRTEGSGNAGATNALRTHGIWFALAVMVIDIGKGAIAVYYFSSFPGADQPLFDEGWSAAFCGIAVVVGHVFPFWFDFKGGKGGATAIGALCVLWPLVVIPALAVWAVVLVASGYVGLSTICAATTPLILALVYQPYGFDAAIAFFSLVTSALIIFAHRSNILRMAMGVESRMTAVMIWRKRPPA